MNRRILEVIALMAFLLAGCGPAPDTIVIGSKNFTEQIVLSEMLAQQIENHTELVVDRRLNLGGTFICHEGIVAGQLDMYVEYTGTALAAILEQPPQFDPAVALMRIQEEYESRFNIQWMPPLGFNNTFAIIVRRSDAEELGLETISDAAPYTSTWTAGFGYEFGEREDGYEGLAATYRLRFPGPPRVMELGLTYQALADGQVDLIAGNSTDGLIDALDLVHLADDKGYFAPYDAVPIVRMEILERYPQVADAIRMLGGLIDEAEMRRLNYAVDGEGRSVEDVVREFLASKGL